MKTGNDMSKTKKMLALAVIAMCLAPVAAQADHLDDLFGSAIALPDDQLEAFIPTGVVGDEPASVEDGSDTSVPDLGIGPAELCGAGSGASLMFGLMGLVGVQQSGRRRRKTKSHGETRGQTD